jgi:hypothetical protein
VYLDEFAFVPSTIQETFFTSVYPTISSGKTTKIMITSTPNGMNYFHKLWKESIEGKNSYKRSEVHWSDVPGRDEAWKEETIRNTSERQFQQDYDGLISTASRTKGHEASSGFAVKSQTGVRTTKTVKRLGCSTFKSIVESDQLVINDHDLFEEMTRFTYKRGSYEAENGNDDLVMCGVLFAWLTTQPYFKELTNTDIVRNIYGLGTDDMDDMIVPFGIIDTGHDEDYSVQDTDLWMPVLPQ